MPKSWPEYFKAQLPEREKKPVEEIEEHKKTSHYEGDFGSRELYEGVFGDINIDIEDRYKFVGPPQEGEAIDFKRWIINELYARKDKIQTADSATIKERKEKGHTFFLGEKKWPKAIKCYRDTWRHLRAWAKAEDIWTDSDEQIFLKETGNPDVESRLEAYLRAGSGKTIEALLLSPGYFAYYNVKAPIAAFRLALKHLLPFFLDQGTTNKMIAAMTTKKKPEEKPTKKEKNRAMEEAKIFETRRKVKDIEWKYLTGLKDRIIEEEMNRKLNTLSDEKRAALTPEEQETLHKEAKFKYAKILFESRVRWVCEKIWTQDSEEKFRKELDLHLQDEKNWYDRQRYLMTQNERNLLAQKRVAKNKKQKDLDRGILTDERKVEIEEDLNEIQSNIARVKDDPSRKAELRRLQQRQRTIKKEMPLTDQEYNDLLAEIDEINTIMQDIRSEAMRRAQEMRWPPYGQQQRRGRRRGGQQSGESMEVPSGDENEEENEDQNV